MIPSMDRNGNHEHPGRYLGAVHHFSRRYFTAQMECLGLPPLAFPLLLHLLRHDNISQDELAGEFLVDKGTVARTMAKLEKARLVTRNVDEHDRRIKRVRITDKARKLRPKFHAAGHAWDEKLLDGFKSEERRVVLTFLKRMTENAQKHWEDLLDTIEAPCNSMTATEESVGE